MVGIFSGGIASKHDHSGDPKKEDVVSGFKDVVGIEFLEIDIVFVGPSES